MSGLLKSLHVLYSGPGSLFLGDWPLWQILLIPTALLGLQCFEAAGNSHALRRLENKLFLGQRRSPRRRGY